VRDREFPIVENKVADERVEEFAGRGREFDAFFLWECAELGETFGQPVRDLDVSTSQRPHEFYVMVSGDAKSITRGNHIPHELDRLDNSGTAINEVTDEYRLAALRMPIDGSAPHSVHVGADDVTELAQQAFEFASAAVNVADYVEWSTFGFFVRPEWLPLYRDSIDLFGCAEDVNVSKALAFQQSE
jgi:hypothetical protein